MTSSNYSQERRGENALYAPVSGYAGTLTSYNPAPLGYVEALGRDHDTLAGLLQPVYTSVDAPLHTQVFGHQERQSQASLEHILHLLDERHQLHKQHMRLLNDRHILIQERLFGARLNGKLDGYKNATRFQQILLQLDEQKRREELQCWKDTAELRGSIFEVAREHVANKHRSSLFQGLEPPAAAGLGDYGVERPLPEMLYDAEDAEEGGYA